MITGSPMVGPPFLIEFYTQSRQPALHPMLIVGVRKRMVPENPEPVKLPAKISKRYWPGVNARSPPHSLPDRQVKHLRVVPPDGPPPAQGDAIIFEIVPWATASLDRLAVLPARRDPFRGQFVQLVGPVMRVETI